MIEPASSGAGEAPGQDVSADRGLRAGLRIGGVALARHQLGAMLALGCERVICIAPAIDADLASLQLLAQQAGVRLQVASGPHALLGMVTATDEVIGLADGLFAEPPLLSGLLEDGPAVLVQPIDPGLAAGFERIDINHAAAGAWRVPGRLVERLADLPADCDAFSALQRVALQAGIAQRPLPVTPLDASRWVLLRSEGEALSSEVAWIRRHADQAGPGNPSFELSRRVVGAFGATLLHGGSGSAIAAAGGFAMVLLAIVAGWFGHPVVAFVLAAIAWLVFLVAALLSRIIRVGLNLASTRVPRAQLFGWLLDAVLVLLADWAIRLQLPGPGESSALGPEMSGHGGALFASVMLVGLCRLVAVSAEARWHAWLDDRGLLALVLAVGIAVAPGMVVVRMLAIAVLAAGLIGGYRRKLDRAKYG
jgi:hypothetical protein